MNVHSSIICNTKKQKEPKCPSSDEWINKTWSIHAMGYFSVTKRNEVLIHTTTWMNLENMLSERNESQTIRYYDSINMNSLE